LIKKNKIPIQEDLDADVLQAYLVGYIYNQLLAKKYKKILLIATGALTNSLTAQQGESIPGIAHAISIEV